MKLYGSITYSRKTWHVNADAHVIIRLKRLFARAKTETKSSIQLKDSEEVCKDLLWVLERYPMSITDKDRAYMESRTTEYDVRSEQVHELLSGTLKPREFELAIPAREYQKVAADMALRMKGLLIGDQIGVGKTITGICTLLPPESRPALVVTLTHLTGQWQREIAKFAPQLTTHILKKGTPYPLEIPDVIITNYHKLSGWRNELAGKMNAVIYDEIQELRRPESQKYAASRLISREATYNVGLSVGPDSIVEFRGGIFGRGYVGTIEDAHHIVAHHYPTYTYEEYILTETYDIEARGWENDAFTWKHVKKFIQHKCTKPVRKIQFNGSVALTVTDDHSVYKCTESGDFDCISSDQIVVGDRLPMDDGKNWSDHLPEEPYDMISIMAENVDEKKLVVAVDLSGTTKEKLGVKQWEWGNFIRQGKYGHYLPLMLFMKHRHILPKPKLMYYSRARGASECEPIVRMSDWAYVLGFFVGDGWLESSGHRVTFAVENARVTEFAEILRNLPYVQLKPDIQKAKGESYELKCNNHFFVAAINRFFGLHKCYDKFIPDEVILQWSDHHKREFLRGLVDSDGMLSVTKRGERRNNKRRYYYSTTSHKLVNTLMSLLRSLNVIGSVSVRKPELGGFVRGRQIYGKRDSYIVNWSYEALTTHELQKGNRYKFAASRGRNHEAAVRYVHTNVEKPEYVYDLEMSGHPSFVANGVLVHNSATPIFNLGIEFYHVIDILRPDVLGTTAEYTREWCSGDVDMNGRASLRDPKAFGLYLRDNGIMIRRTRKDIGRELPPVSKIIEYVDSDEKAFTEMEGGVADLAKFILAKSGTRTERMQASGELDWKMRQATGLAKCVAPTTKIVKFDGSIVEARTLQVGDLLMGPDSKPRKILATTEGLDEMYEVSSTSRNPVFNPYTVNSNHILALKHTGKIRHGDRFLFAHYNKGTHLEISVKDYVSKSNYFKHMVKGYKSTCIDFDCTEVPIDPYFLGLWLGDGSSESASITTMDTEIREYLYAFASKCGLTIRVKFGSRTAPTYNLTRSKFTRNAGDEWRNPLRAGLVSCNVLHNKHIPKCYLVNDRNTRLNVLAGLLDSDGHLNTGNCYEISSKWKHMAEQICWLAQSLGFRTSLTKVTNKCQTGTFTAYKTIITGSGLENIPVLLPRKKASPRKQIKDALRSGIKVTPQGIGEYFGFELDGDGLFLLEDFTVTHNSPYVAEFVKLLVDSGEKVVVFAWHRAVYDVLMKKLAEYKPVLYTGSESVPQKEAARKAFVEGDSKILLMSLRSGAGLDGLQKVCSTVVIGELDWSPGVIEQCIGRVDRDEQDTPVMAYFAISNEGSDPVIMDSLGVKRGQIEGVRDPNGELILDVPMNENKIQQLAEAVLRKRGIAIPSESVLDLPA